MQPQIQKTCYTEIIQGSEAKFPQVRK